MTAPQPEIEILVFELEGAPVGADVVDVVRIESRGRGEGKVLVVRGADERLVEVDAVLGVRTVPVVALRALPAAARGSPEAIGVWLDGDRSVLLVDLQQMGRKAA